MNEKDILITNSLRVLGIDMISNANSGHPGIVLGAAPIMYTLYSKHLNVSVTDENWINRDRFILSAGHGSALLYANLHLAGYNISIEDLKKFRQINSNTPGHPELGVTPGVDMSTGPLGQGVANAVGIAIGEKFLNSKYKNKNKSLFNFYTYVLVGDGDLMEGISYESCSLAGHLGLGKLIVLYDSNDITLDGEVKDVNSEDTKTRFEAMGWHYQLVKDDNIDNIDDAIYYAKDEKTKPSIIEIKTKIGKYSELEGTNEAHGKPLSITDANKIKRKCGMDIDMFAINPQVRELYKNLIYERCNKEYQKWAVTFNEFMNSDDVQMKKEIEQIVTGKIEIDYDMLKITSAFLSEETLRQSNQRVMKSLSAYTPNLIGGSADLKSSCLTIVDEKEIFTKTNPLGQNILFGVREHAMGAILNGLATLNVSCFGSTFLTFSDYLRPAIRMSALMNLPVTYIFTHDSINVGEDGPTHQPIEQLDSLRLIPNLDVYRPANVSELSGSWINIMKRRKPTALIVAKSMVNNDLPTHCDYVYLGAYPVIFEENKPDAIIVASGTELTLAAEICKLLKEKGKQIRLVSMVSKELFEEQPANYKQQVFPLGIKTFVIEASTAHTLEKYASNYNYLFNIEKFGLSAPADDVSNYFDFNVENIVFLIERMIGK